MNEFDWSKGSRSAPIGTHLELTFSVAFKALLLSARGVRLWCCFTLSQHQYGAVVGAAASLLEYGSRMALAVNLDAAID